MDPSISDFLRLYGPMGIGWILAGYLGLNLIKSKDAEIDSKVKLAVSIDALTTLIREIREKMR